MILDFLTVFFLVAGLLLLIRLIRQRRRALSKLIIENPTRPREQPATAVASSFAARDRYRQAPGPLQEVSLDQGPRPIVRQPAAARSPDEEARRRPPAARFDHSRLTSMLETLASESAQDPRGNRAASGAVGVTAAEPSAAAGKPPAAIGENTLGAPQPVEVPRSRPDHRKTITSADDDLAEMIGKLASGPDSSRSS
jgi:hypothetical protein